jgi:hypothetical protein
MRHAEPFIFWVISASLCLTRAIVYRNLAINRMFASGGKL